MTGEGLGLSVPHASKGTHRSSHHKAQDRGSHRTTPRPVLSAPPSRASSISASGSEDTSLQPCISESHIGLRSLKGVDGLRMAENGDAMVQFDLNGDGGGMGSRFLEGNHFVLDPMSPGGGALPRHAPARSQRDAFPPELSAEISLPSHDTLLSMGRSQSRNAAELKTLLGNSNARLKPNAVMLPPSGSHCADKKGQAVSLEQAKPRARVEVDIVLESNTLVQGGYIRGHIKVRVRKRAKKETPVFLAEGKLRVVGFESIPSEDDTHTFYQCAAPLSAVTDASQSLYDTPLGPDGFAQAVEGVHVLPFAMELPLDSSFGNPKGVLSLSSGVIVRYVVMISLKVRSSDNGRRSIAHFYRNCEVWPRLNPSTVLSVAPRPLQASIGKPFSMLSAVGNHDHKAKLTAQLHRLHWVAGQRCHVKILVSNGTRKTVKSCTLTLVRTTTIFRPKPALDAGGGGSMTADPDACQTSTSHKASAHSILEMGHGGAKGYASAKGWWTGVKPGQELEFSHFILLPTNALSVSRGRLLEIEYSIRVTISAGSLTSDVFVTLPIRIINFISIDPPPSAALLSTNGAYFRSVKRQPSSSSTSAKNQWRVLSAMGETSGVMHVQDGPPPPTSASDQSLFSEESSASLSMPDLAGVAVGAGPGTLRITNPDRSRMELTRVMSEASVYSTDSAVPEPSSSASSESNSSNTSFEYDRRAGWNKGRRATGLANLALDSDDASDADVLNSVLGDMRRGHRHQHICSDDGGDDEDEEYIGAPRGYGITALERDRTEGGGHGLTSFARRVNQKLAVSHSHEPISSESSSDSYISDDHDHDTDQTPRMGYSHAQRSEVLQIPLKLQPGGSRPPVPPRSAKRPRSIHVAGGKPHKSSLRGQRSQNDLRNLPRPPSQTLSQSNSSRDNPARLAYLADGNESYQSQEQQPRTTARPAARNRRDDSDGSVEYRIATLEARVKDADRGYAYA